MKTTIGAIIFVTILIIFAGAFSGRSTSNPSLIASVDNVSMENGKQIVAISAKGGYTPRLTDAKAEVPTIIRVDTNGTFDCSAAIAIPSIGYRKNLPMTGTSDIEVPPQKAGTKLQGLCAMGMYNFTINFN